MSARRMTIEDLLSFRWITHVATSPDGRTIVYAQEVIEDLPRADGPPTPGYRSALWLVDAAGGTPRQFTTGEARDQSPVWSPDGTRVLFLSDRGAAPSDRRPPKHLWVIPVDGGEARRITQGEHGPSEAVWSPQGTQIAFTGKPVRVEQPSSDVRIITRMRHKFDGEGFWDGRYKHIFVVPSEGGPARQVTTGDFDHRDPAWSPDGTHLALVANRNDDADYTNVADIWVLALAGGDLRRLTGGVGPVFAPAWSPDGSMIAYLGHENACMQASNVMLWVVPADGSGPPRCLTRHFDRSLVHHIISDMRAHPTAGRPVWSPDGRFVFVMVADGGTTQLAAVDVATGGVRLLTSGRREIYAESYDAARRRVAMAISDPATPGDLWVGEVEGLDEGRPVVVTERRLTAVNNALLDEVELAAPQRFAYLGADDWTIEGWVIPPVGYDPLRRYPTILAIHGGPHAAYGETFFHEFQVLAALGYAVVLTNPRGSQGYGQTFTAATHHDWGGKDFADIMAGLDAALARFPFLDPDRLGVEGGSYGGYMTTWAIGHTQRFKAAVTMRSIANCLSQWGTSDLAYFKGYWEFPGDPWDAPEFYWEKSPLAYVNRITTPLLILHSENDLRCPISEGEQLFAALKKQGKEVVFARFPDESHDLSRSGKPQHRVERLRLIVQWFTSHIPPVPAAGRREDAPAAAVGAGEADGGAEGDAEDLHQDR
ncbi:MAG: S9 family peptidase [Armatimonadota bacterium]|nr:S9 family peptidase [Armatimonadota bacterium]MDR7518583.1 S9 family peptidase [Armatimonadota bacterium]MDR7549703.1 S9 family peptidase [Armatimonadota bacterium]